MSVFGEQGTRELATPLVSASQPAGTLQQVMSPTQGYGTTANPSPPPGRDGIQIRSGSTPPLENAHSGAGGFEPMAAGRAFEGAGQRESLQDSGEAPQMSTTMDGGVGVQMVVPVSGNVSPGESPGLEASTGMLLGTESGDAESGGRVVTGASAEGFVTPRSQQGLPTIAEMVEGFPASGLQLMTRVGDFFRVARTEVVQVPAVRQGTYATPPRTATSQTRDSPSGASGPMALGDGSLGSHSSPPQMGAHGTPTSFAPPPGRDGPLLSADMLQRMQALEQRAPLLYASMPERPQSRTDSSSLPQEAIQAEVARQLVGFDQRAQAQDLEIQRMRRQLEEATQREQALREQVRSSAQIAPTIPNEAPRPPLQDAQVRTPIAYQVHDAAAQAVEALRAPAQTAASATGPTFGRGCKVPKGYLAMQRHPEGLGNLRKGIPPLLAQTPILEPKTGFGADRDFGL